MTKQGRGGANELTHSPTPVAQNPITTEVLRNRNLPVEEEEGRGLRRIQGDNDYKIHIDISAFKGTHNIEDTSYEVEIVEGIEDEPWMFEVEDCDLTTDIDCTLDVVEAQLEDDSLSMEKLCKDDNLCDIIDMDPYSFGISKKIDLQFFQGRFEKIVFLHLDFEDPILFLPSEEYSLKHDLIISSHLQEPEVTDFAALMGIIYSMVKHDYVMQERIVNSLNLTSLSGELESYCMMWSLRPFVNDEIMHQAWRLIP